MCCYLDSSAWQWQPLVSRWVQYNSTDFHGAPLCLLRANGDM